MKRELVVAVCLLFGAAPAFAGSFQVVSSSETTAHGLDHTVTVVQNGSDPLYRFHVDRVVQHGANACDLRGAIILTPALGNNAALYTTGDDPGGADLQHSIAGNLAKEGLDVYIYSPPQSFFAPGVCNSIDCSIMAGWGMQARLDDLVFIRHQVKDQFGDRKPIIAGLSLGGMTALAAVNQNPHAYSGMVDLDGILLTDNAALSASYQIICGGLRAAIAAGQVFNDQLDPGIQLILQLSLADPNGLSPIPGFPPGTTNRQAYMFALTAPSAGPPGSIFPAGFLLAAGDVAANHFFFASEDRLASQISNFNYYVTNAEVADVACSLGGDPTFTSNLGAYRNPSLIFKQGNGFGDLIDANAAALGGPVQVIDHADFGHVDLVSSPDHKKLFEKQISHWIDEAGVF